MAFKLGTEAAGAVSVTAPGTWSGALQARCDQSVELSARRDGEELVFSVSDRGPGVPEADRARIFEAFYRSAGSAPDAAARAGLGLSIARTLAHIQGGSVNVCKDHLTPDGSVPGDVPKQGVDGISREVVCDALTNEEGLRLSAIPGAGHDRVQRVRVEIDREHRNMWWEGAKSPLQDILLLALGHRMIHFKDTGALDAPDAIGAAIETSAEDHDLVHAVRKRRPEEIIDVSRPHRHRAPRPRPVPIQERPRHARTDYWQPRQGQRPPETPAEKRRGERVRKESRRGSA